MLFVGLVVASATAEYEVLGSILKSRSPLDFNGLTILLHGEIKLYIGCWKVCALLDKPLPNLSRITDVLLCYDLWSCPCRNHYYYHYKLMEDLTEL